MYGSFNLAMLERLGLRSEWLTATHLARRAECIDPWELCTVFCMKVFVLLQRRIGGGSLYSSQQRAGYLSSPAPPPPPG